MTKSQKLLLWVSLAAIAVWLVPGGQFLIVPLTYLNTHIHEISHAVVAVATGGQVGRIAVNPDGSGFATIGGGSMLLIASAGYVGSALVGGWLIYGSRTPAGARKMIWTTFGFLTAALVLWNRDIFTIFTALAWMGILVGMAKKLPEKWLPAAGQFLGIQQCFTATHALWDLLYLSNSRPSEGVAFGSGSPMTDAHILAEATFVPPQVWALGWAVIGAGTMGLALWRAWGSSKPERRRIP